MRAPDRVVEAVSIRSRLFSREILAARPVSSEDGKFQSAPGFLAGRYWNIGGDTCRFAGFNPLPAF